MSATDMPPADTNRPEQPRNTIKDAAALVVPKITTSVGQKFHSFDFDSLWGPDLTPELIQDMKMAMPAMKLIAAGNFDQAIEVLKKVFLNEEAELAEKAVTWIPMLYLLYRVMRGLFLLGRAFTSKESPGKISFSTFTVTREDSGHYATDNEWGGKKYNLTDFFTKEEASVIEGASKKLAQRQIAYAKSKGATRKNPKFFGENTESKEWLEMLDMMWFEMDKGQVMDEFFNTVWDHVTEWMWPDNEALRFTNTARLNPFIAVIQEMPEFSYSSVSNKMHRHIRSIKFYLQDAMLGHKAFLYDHLKIQDPEPDDSRSFVWHTPKSEECPHGVKIYLNKDSHIQRLLILEYMYGWSSLRDNLWQQKFAIQNEDLVMDPEHAQFDPQDQQAWLHTFYPDHGDQEKIKKNLVRGQFPQEMYASGLKKLLKQMADSEQVESPSEQTPTKPETSEEDEGDPGTMGAMIAAWKEANGIDPTQTQFNNQNDGNVGKKKKVRTSKSAPWRRHGRK